ncbi:MULTISPECIES: 50S ribosomal protein L6 [Roseivirga]|jgi:large subunit ribosomal protein L6|uniref:Large ribosomal subunit protein uL6 n=1 Tax=Roseivirga thermotolerans TaxID=1758176 RepID=A0ABQ3IAZ9_9BACT|nr:MULTISPECIES: 50S ribosomal protein L6 [Roseivirga]MEC7752733.1 50S ribosomal protein L6 [Bacteroidota bacterium]GHE66089.1 50S ribosomal protein L6 [Roseivirga thermotolerans]|tara:strand:+ start:3961 stop:4512 length:552 start_codon:yes stop_codon:yes gene_type:complete
MSRIGNKPITLPSGVSVDVAAGAVTVKGPKGELTQEIDPDFKVTVEDGVMSIVRPTDQKRHKSLHGLYRALLNNMVVGVNQGYTKELELVGVGYKAAVANNVLELNLGYSHNIYMQVPDEVKAEAKMDKGKNPIVTLSSTDKELIGQVAAQIRSLRKTEPYKGKGIKFVGEKIRRKAGKTASK